MVPTSVVPAPPPAAAAVTSSIEALSGTNTRPSTATLLEDPQLRRMLSTGVNTGCAHDVTPQQ